MLVVVAELLDLVTIPVAVQVLSHGVDLVREGQHAEEQVHAVDGATIGWIGRGAHRAPTLVRRRRRLGKVLAQQGRARHLTILIPPHLGRSPVRRSPGPVPVVDRRGQIVTGDFQPQPAQLEVEGLVAGGQREIRNRGRSQHDSPARVEVLGRGDVRVCHDEVEHRA